MKVAYFFRKPEKDYFSIEELFNNIIKALPDQVEGTVFVMPEYSRGLINRVKNVLFGKKHQGDVNHITGDIYYTGLLTRKQKTVITYHDCVYRQHTKGIKKAVVWFFWYFLPVRRAKHITAISEFTKQELIAATGIEANRVKVIHNCFPKHYKTVLKEFNGEEPKILQVGTGFNKNLERVAEALQGIVCELLIIGNLKESQRDILDKFKIKYKNFINLSTQEVYEKYAACDMVTFVSFYEGFGMPIVEANVVGRPIITSNRAAMPEIAANAACIVDPYSVEEIRSGIVKVIQNQEYRQNLIANGFENVKRFYTEVTVAKYVEIYKEIAAS